MTEPVPAAPRPGAAPPPTGSPLAPGLVERILHAVDDRPAYLDGRVFILYDDTPALVYGPICERIHGFDERVNLDSVRQTTKTIALFMAQWCGLESTAEVG